MLDSAERQFHYFAMLHLVALASPAAIAGPIVAEPTGGLLHAFLYSASLFRQGGEGRWAELATNFGGRYLQHLAADPTDAAHLVAVADESAILETMDGGRTWKGFGK